MNENEKRRNSMLENLLFSAPTSLVLGKALEPFNEGQGKIMALITRENSKGIFCVPEIALQFLRTLQ